MDIVIPIITFIVGGILGFVVGAIYLRKQMMNMTMDNKKMQDMAKKMGMNLNQKQMNQVNKMMKNMNKR